MKERTQTELLDGLIYRPPTGKPEDRMLALATGRTETGEKINAVQREPETKAA